MSLINKKINKALKILCSNFIIFFILILVIDNLLFSFPNLFPKEIVRYLLKETQIKYYNKSLKSPHIHIIYDSHFNKNGYLEYVGILKELTKL